MNLPREEWFNSHPPFTLRRKNLEKSICQAASLFSSVVEQALSDNQYREKAVNTIQEARLLALEGLKIDELKRNKIYLRILPEIKRSPSWLKFNKSDQVYAIDLEKCPIEISVASMGKQSPTMLSIIRESLIGFGNTVDSIEVVSNETSSF